MIVSTDFSEASQKALTEAARLLTLGVIHKVTLLHVVEPPVSGLRIQTDELHRQMGEVAERQLSQLKEDFLRSHPAASTLLKQGHAADTICETARTLGADLIAISSHGNSLIRHYMLGSVAERVSRHAPCPVLIVR